MDCGEGKGETGGTGTGLAGWLLKNEAQFPTQLQTHHQAQGRRYQAPQRPAASTCQPNVQDPGIPTLALALAHFILAAAPRFITIMTTKNQTHNKQHTTDTVTQQPTTNKD